MARAAASLRPLALSRGTLHRHSDLRHQPGLIDALLADPRTRVIDLVDGRARVVEDTAGAGEPTPSLRYRRPKKRDRGRLLAYLGHDAAEGGAAYLLSVGEDTSKDGSEGERKGLRSVGAQLSDIDAAIFTTATGLANWHARHQFCARCGQRTEPAMAGWIRVCPADGSEHYPRTDPAVIMSVIDDDDRLLLARGVGFAPAGMSVLAGFVEPGESLVAAVAREVHEEVGVTVTDVTYLGDQPWPFPLSLMVGFTARATTTDLTLQRSEIEEATWFTRDDFAAALSDGSLRISGRISIARRLIEHWYGAELDVPEASLRG